MNAPLEELKARFLNVYSETITREGADSLLQWLTESDFFVAPASTRFHGSHEGGLLQHSLNVYDCLKRNVEQAGLQDTYSPETIAVSALLHDVCKVNFYKKGYRNAKDEETEQWYNNFLQSSARATNEYRGCTDIAYMVNRFADPNITKFFASKDVSIDAQAYALSEMLQWIWRSAIRDDKPINLYIPSKRMRELLINWINKTNKGGQSLA